MGQLTVVSCPIIEKILFKILISSLLPIGSKLFFVAAYPVNILLAMLELNIFEISLQFVIFQS